MSEGKPCEKCPWMSRDPRDKEAVADPSVQATMKSGRWFCCHVNMGTCFGAQIRYEQHVKKSQQVTT